MLDVFKIYAVMLEAVEAAQRGDMLAVRRTLRRIEGGEFTVRDSASPLRALLGAVHQSDLCPATSAPAARNAALHVVEK
jgi:hypothetical protein